MFFFFSLMSSNFSWLSLVLWSKWPRQQLEIACEQETQLNPDCIRLLQILDDHSAKLL